MDRPINRIDKFLEAIGRFWKNGNSNMRFGQLMVSFNEWHVQTYGIDIFYLEEREFLKHFDIFLNKPNPENPLENGK